MRYRVLAREMSPSRNDIRKLCIKGVEEEYVGNSEGLY